MSNDKYKDDVLRLISKNGPTGVNQLSRELDIPLSTLQKYLHRQSYFKLNDDKKWDLPENVIGEIKSNSLVLMANVVENSILLLQSQLEEIQQSVANVISPIETLKRGINAIGPSVATASKNESGQSNIDPRLSKLQTEADTLVEILKKKKGNIPNEHLSLVLNYDHVGLILKEGITYTRDFLESGLYNMLAGNTDELDEDTLQVLKENQKEA